MLPPRPVPAQCGLLQVPPPKQSDVPSASLGCMEARRLHPRLARRQAQRIRGVGMSPATKLFGQDRSVIVSGMASQKGGTH